MKALRNYLDKIKPNFEEGGKFHAFRSVFDGFETFLFVPNTTSKSGTHIHDAIDSKRIMSMVVIALIPALLFGMYNVGYQHFHATGAEGGFWAMFFYGFLAVLPLLLVSYIVGLGIEFISAQIKGHEIQEGFLVTGFLIPLIVPVDTPLWMVAVATAFAVIFAKEVFGGTGKNIANPAAVGRVFMFISFAITTYAAANFGAVIDGSGETLTSGATYLSGAMLGENPDVGAMSLVDLFLGTGLAGCIGETCKLALIAGYVYLVVRRVIKWWQPALYLVVLGLMTALLNLDFAFFLPSILSGGAMFGAIFMFTDYVTSPKGVFAQIAYYGIAGLLTAVLRHLTGIEVVSFVIVLMNLIVPLLDMWIRRKPFGYKREKKNKEVAGK